MVTLGVFRGDLFRRSEIKLELRNGVNFADFSKVNPEKSKKKFDSIRNQTFSSTEKYLHPQKSIS